MTARPIVLGVFVSDKHSFSKCRRESINLLERLGVEGDAHCGKLVQHLWDAKKDPLRPNFRQVHLIHSELLDEVNARGFSVLPGDLGENITTRGIDLLGLPTGARLEIGENAVVEVTGLRSPCVQINTFQEGLLEAVIERRKGVGLIRKTGVMSVVIRGGVIRNGDAIEADVIILATGFNTIQGGLGAISITGLDTSTTLGQSWKNGKSSYLNLSFAGYPNLFYVCGLQSLAA